MKINGKVFQHVKNKLVEFDIYEVKLKNGPMNGKISLVGNSTFLYLCGHRYELNPEGDYCYAPESNN